MKHILTLAALVFATSCFGQEACPNVYDNNDNNTIDIEDFLGILSLFADDDTDDDGIWDSQDACIDLGACNYAASPTEPCAFIDVLGECGGGCEGDGDGDGICDDEDDCVGVVDECGVCNGPGPSSVLIEDIVTVYDSVFLPVDGTWMVFAESIDTVFSFVCPELTLCDLPYKLEVTSEVSQYNPNSSVYRVYVHSDSSTDKLSAVYGTDEFPMYLFAPEGVFNSPINTSWNASGINPSLFGFFPDLVEDSYATIKLDVAASASDLDNVADPSLVQDEDLELTISEFFTEGGDSLIVDTVIGGTWYTLNSLANAEPDPNGRWLVAQVTTSGSFSGRLNASIVLPFFGTVYGQVSSTSARVSWSFDGSGTFCPDSLWYFAPPEDWP
jgi:hypothetical protein